MERKLQHFSHEHPLILKAEDRRVIDEGVQCKGCSEPISGPFYRCGVCGYYLHKVCAELPPEMNHPMHSQHPLTLLSKPPYSGGEYLCNMCTKTGTRFVYNCSLCNFNVDPICASASHTIQDKCHQHPLTPIQHLISLPCCHLCQTQKKGVSYKCNICPFWVHQNCIVLLQSTVKHRILGRLLVIHRIIRQLMNDYDEITLLQSVPSEYGNVSQNCTICHHRISMSYCVYYCAKYTYLAHVSCLISRDQDPVLLPLQQKSTVLISWFSENYTDGDKKIRDKINSFSHSHPLFLIDHDQIKEKICEACVQPLSTPSYGCIGCDYFLHKCCTELLEKITHPFHPQHQISLGSYNEIIRCSCCDQWCNGFGYKCPGENCESFFMDIKCASLLRLVKHEAHQHPLIPRLIPSSTCSACSREPLSNCILQCDPCSFSLCFVCAMAPSMMKHRYDEHPFILTYSPPENHYNDYICDLCEGDLHPKPMFYHCCHCDQFTHPRCMLIRGADSNIKYGKCYKFEDHEHELALVSCTYNRSLCKKCEFPISTGYSVGLECVPCDYRIHLLCAMNIPTTTFIPN